MKETLKVILSYVADSEIKSYCESGHDRNHIFRFVQRVWPKFFGKKLTCWCKS